MFDNPECTATAVSKIKNVHFTVCQKPWSCFKHDRNVACTPFLEKWYELRNEVRNSEKRWAGVPRRVVRGLSRPTSGSRLIWRPLAHGTNKTFNPHM
jgi:hypothetical protein